MVAQFPCPYLKGEVELTSERGRHITERHPDCFRSITILSLSPLLPTPIWCGHALTWVMISRWFDQVVNTWWP